MCPSYTNGRYVLGSRSDVTYTWHCDWATPGGRTLPTNRTLAPRSRGGSLRAHGRPRVGYGIGIVVRPYLIVTIGWVGVTVVGLILSSPRG